MPASADWPKSPQYPAARCRSPRKVAGDKIDDQRQQQCRRAEQEEYGVGVLAVREDEREAIAGDRLTEREGGRAETPRRGLSSRIARDQLAGAPDRDRPHPGDGRPG